MRKEREGGREGERGREREGERGREERERKGETMFSPLNHICTNDVMYVILNSQTTSTPMPSHEVLWGVVDVRGREQW